MHALSVAYLAQGQVMWPSSLPIQDAQEQGRFGIVHIYGEGHFKAPNGCLQIPFFLYMSVYMNICMNVRMSADSMAYYLLHPTAAHWQ